MPIFKAGPQLLFYAHVPKCGGMAVSWYLAERFGAVAFSDKHFTRHDRASLWSRTSPQHIDTESLGRLFPPGFFDATFTIVRHPVPRLISAFHFQREKERSISVNVSFSDWLAELDELRAENPFAYDNHVRPMTEIVPEGAQVFHMEHGLDAMITWLDTVTGTRAGPRALPRINARSAAHKAEGPKVVPTPEDMERITQIYAADFARFGYDPARPRETSAPAPVLPEGFAAERDAALREMSSPMGKLRAKLNTFLKA